MSPRKRISQSDDAQNLPLREKRRKTTDVEDESDLEESLSHMDEPIAKRALRSSHKSDVAIRLNDHGSPELAQDAVALSNPNKSHKRFSSKSPPPANMDYTQPEAEEEDVGEEESDDDEAPEAISHAHAAAETKAVQAREAQLLKQRGQDERDKRRKRDAQFKTQAQSSGKRRSKAEQDYQESEDETDEKAVEKTKIDLDNLPTLLPEELLALETPIRPPTPPTTKQKSTRQKFMDALTLRERDEASADVVHQGKKIRVLQTTNTLLPPKATLGANNRRERLLNGRAAFSKIDKRGKNVSAYRRRPGPQAFV